MVIGVIKEGGLGYGEKIFFFKQIRSDSAPGRKKNFEFQNVKMVKLGVVGSVKSGKIIFRNRNRITNFVWIFIQKC